MSKPNLRWIKKELLDEIKRQEGVIVSLKEDVHSLDSALDLMEHNHKKEVEKLKQEIEICNKHNDFLLERASHADKLSLAVARMSELLYEKAYKYHGASYKSPTRGDHERKLADVLMSDFENGSNKK